MKPAGPNAFTLIEVSLALGLAAFCLMALLGLFPIGLKEAAASVLETRGTHLAQTVFAALESGPFEAANCGGMTLDLATLDEATPVQLEAAFPAGGEARLEKNCGAAADYKLELRFRKMAPSPSSGVMANCVTLTVTPLHASQSVIRFQSIIGNL
jgi:hypothetical protein